MNDNLATSATSATSATNLKVAYHTCGQLFAGDDQDYPPGWYLFDGLCARPVEVLEPHSSTPLAV